MVAPAQRDPWSPVALAAVLACPLQAANASTDKVKHLLYLDDRTLLAADEPSLRTALSVWTEFEDVSRMRTRDGKTQFFCRSAGSSATAEVLGASLGQSSRALTTKELKRRKQAGYIAQRIGLLPVTLKLRATLAAVVYSPKASWGSFLNCRRLTKQDLNLFSEVGAVTWDIMSPAPAQDRAAHELGDSWRLALLNCWLLADRKDARSARAEGLQIDKALLKRLRSWAGQTSGHAVSVMCGGFSPDAVWTPTGGVRGCCYSCNQAISPHTRHVISESSAHDALRSVAMPVPKGSVGVVR